MDSDSVQFCSVQLGSVRFGSTVVTTSLLSAACFEAFHVAAIVIHANPPTCLVSSHVAYFSIFFLLLFVAVSSMQSGPRGILLTMA